MNDQRDAADAKLDGLLRSWADECANDSSGEARLLRAIVVASPRRPQKVPSLRETRFALAACTAVVILLATSIAIPFPPHSASKAAVHNSAIASQVGLSELWSGTTDLFGMQLNWLCDLDGELLLGVDEGATKFPARDRAFVLLTVRVRESPSADWSAVWSGRVVCPLGEAIDFVSDKTGSSGTIWLQSRPDGRLVTSHWLNWPDHPEISGSVDIDVSPGETRVVAQQVADGRSIQVIQQVWIPHAG